MMVMYVTFGQTHVHSINGKTFDKDCVAKIYCNDYSHGRELAFEFFDGKFCNTYTNPKDAHFEYYPRGLIEVN